MREIKFRVWNPTNNRMIKIGDKSNDTALWIDENGFYVLDHFAGFPQPIADHLDGLILMQYTGLKDKYGVEIYEGDIVKSQGEYWQDEYREVCFGDGYFSPMVRAEYGHNCIDSYNPEEFEVIGNIYEHPQLTEVK